MVRRNSAGQDYTNNADGFTLGGGATQRNFSLTGSDVTITGSGSNTFTFPGTSDDLVGADATQTLTHKTISGIDNTLSDISADSLIDGTTNHVFTAADDTKLSGIEAGADVTDATNVDAAGAVMNSDTSTAAMNFVVDEDAMTSNSATKVPTQQSVKAYVDASTTSLTDLGITATASEINVLDGITATTTELNYTDGVTSSIQTQLDARVPTSRTINGSVLSSNITLTQDNIGDGTTYKQYSSTEKSKLSGIEAGADVTDATNVDAAGAVMNSDTSTAAMSFVVDEDAMTSNSATKVPTQQSTKAYVDNSISGKEDTITGGTTAQYWRGDKSWQTLNKAAVGLSNVDNTADASKNVLSATKLTTTRSIGGVNFDGTANINLPGVNTTGSQNTTGSAASLTTSRSLQVSLSSTSAQSFNGTANATSIGVSGSLPLTSLAAGYVKGSNNGAATTLTLWKGTLSQYNALGTYDSNTVYVIT